MTLDELTFLIERLAEAGCTAEQLVAAAKAARDWRVERRLHQAVKRAIAPAAAAESGFVAANADSAPINTDTESGFGGGDGRKTRARKGLLTTRRLRPCARQIGAALVERFNLTTGRCDAGVQKLADDAGYDLRSARRAIAQLEAAGLFTRAVQAGRGHANSYTPHWPALEDLAAEVEHATGVRAGLTTKPDSQNRTLGRKPDGRVRQNQKNISPSGIGANGQLALRMFSAIDGGGQAEPVRQHKALVATEMALRGKYARDSRLGVLVAGFHALDAADQALIAEAELAGRGGGLRTFERMLLERHGGQATGPPRAKGAG